MKRIVIALAAAALLVGAAPKGSESKWNVKKGSATIAAVTLLHEDGKARAEWKKDAKSSPIVFLSGDGKLWVRESGGDVESKDYEGGAEASIVPALIKNADKQAKLTIAGGYTATRTSLANKSIDAAEFTVRPKKGAAQRLARLSGDLFGPTTSGASATAGGRGASGSGLKLKDGGNYDELTKLENRDAEWKSKLDSALTEFQKDGKVGKERSE
jgi:hypothetical protein